MINILKYKINNMRLIALKNIFLLIILSGTLFSCQAYELEINNEIQDGDALNEGSNYTENSFIIRLWNAISSTLLFKIYVVVNIILVIAFFLILRIVIKTDDTTMNTKFCFLFSSNILYFFPIPFLGLVSYTKYLQKKWRNEIQYSDTGVQMEKLEDFQKTQYLSEGQKCEERLNATTYDVWRAFGERDVKIIPYENYKSGILVCTECRFSTSIIDYDKVILKPNYSRDGQGERQSTCQHCNKIDVFKYKIPQLKHNTNDDEF